MNLPDQVCRFLLDLNKAIRDKNWRDISVIYDTTFPNTSQEYFQGSRWPTADQVKELYIANNCHHDVVLLFYQELAMRHVFNHMAHTITIRDRTEAFDIYEALFALMQEEICENNRGSLPIPIKWLWGMIDEFIYQYHDTQRYKVKIIGQSGDLSIVDRDFCEVYDPTTVKAWLMAFIESSDIKEFLRSASWNSEYSQRENLGYFALIGLLRLHVISGDFHNALIIGSHIPISTRAFYWKVPVANAQLFYHLGISQIMSGRYIDAIKAMTPLLVFVTNSSQYMSSASSYEMRIIDRMYCLARLCDMLSTSPLRLQEGILSVIKESQQEKWIKLQGDDDGTFVSVYNRSMPKFVGPFRLSCMTSDQYDLTQYNRGNQYLELLLERRRLADTATQIKGSTRLYNFVPMQKLCPFISNGGSTDIETAHATCIQVKTICTQQVLHHPEDPEDERLRQFQTSRILVSSEFADFRVDETQTVSVKTVHEKEDKLEKLEKAITSTNELLAQVRKINASDIPFKFSLDAGEPARLSRVKRDGGRFNKRDGGDMGAARQRA